MCELLPDRPFYFNDPTQAREREVFRYADDKHFPIQEDFQPTSSRGDICNARLFLK